jgi:MFS transporter, putative metabolite transport protein
VDAESNRLSKGQKAATTFAALGGFVDGFDLLLISAALLLLTPYFDLSAFQVGLLVSSAYLGSWLGALAFGYYTDRKGRRTVFMLNMVAFIVSSILCALAPSYAILLFCRFLVGVAIGMDFPTAGAMISEFAPPRDRGKLLSMWQLLWSVGALMSPFVAILLLPLGDEAWRWMFATGAVPALFILVGRSQIPETPRWLLSQGKVTEAREVLAWAGQPTDLRATELPTGELSGPENAPTSTLAAFGQLFSPQYWKITVLVSAVCFTGAFGPLFLSTYSSFLAKFYGFTTDVQALLFGSIIWVFYLVGNVLNLFLTDRVGRKPLLVVGAAIITVVLIVASWIGIEGNVALVFSVLVIAAVAHWGGVDQGIWQYPAEVFPTRFRATGRGFTTSFIRLSAFLAALLTPIMFEAIGFSSTMLVLAGIESSVIVLGLFLPEMKGRTLEEIESQYEEKAPQYTEERSRSI